MNALPTIMAHSLSERLEDKKWLIDQLWTNEGVGIIGGEPKCCKSFLALNMAIAVSSGIACLSKYQVQEKGSVVLYAAEDAPHIVKGRLEGLCRPLGIDLKTLDIHVITVPVLRLDKSEDQEKLKITIEQLRPKLLILDPFVRLHRIDENSSGEVAPILASLREIQRAYHTAIIVVHHAKKSTGALRAGQTLRGSSEFHAWGDVNLYLRRNREDQLNLTIEHRDGKSQSDIKIELTDEKEGMQMRVLKNENTNNNTPQVLSLNEKLFKLFNDELTPLPLIEIRARVGARAETVNKVVSEMLTNNQLCKVAGGYQLVR